MVANGHRSKANLANRSLEEGQAEACSINSSAQQQMIKTTEILDKL